MPNAELPNAGVTAKRALVRGGWDGHEPVAATELFLPFLRETGCEVRIEESPAVYADVAAGTGVAIRAVGSH
jgi:hypothetical protein